MSWYSKVFWSEGLFLRPHHLQQNDRYVEHLLEKRVRDTSRRIRGALPSWRSTRTSPSRANSRCAAPPASCRTVRRSISRRQPDSRRDRRAGDGRRPDRLADDAGRGAEHPRGRRRRDADSASRYVIGSETFIDSTSALRIEEEIDIAFPRLGFELRKTGKPGYIGLGIARILEVRDKNILFDEKFVPPMLVCAAHPVIDGWINRIIGWIENKLDELARYAADPTVRRRLAERRLSGPASAEPHHSGAESFPALGLCPSRAALRGVAAGSRANLRHLLRRNGGRANYPAYDHDDLENVFTPLMRDIQDFLSARFGRRASAWRSSSAHRTRSCRRSAIARYSATRPWCWRLPHGGR